MRRSRFTETAASQLREAAEEKAKAMAEANPTRHDMVEKLEELVAQYNAGSIDAERFFPALKGLVASMDEEDRRAARQGLTEEELAIFDLLTKPAPVLTNSEETFETQQNPLLLAQARYIHMVTCGASDDN